MPTMDAVYEHFQNVLQSHRIRICFGANKNTFGQANYANPIAVVPKLPTISFNEVWVDEAQNCFEAVGNNENFDSTNKAMFQMSCHYVVGIVKLLHEFANTLTRDILLYECNIKRDNAAAANVPLDNKENRPFQGTPMKVGSNAVNENQIVGDMGFEAENYLLGNQFRMCIIHCNWIPIAVYFEQIESWVVEVTKRVRGPQSLGSQEIKYVKEKYGLMKANFEHQDMAQYVMNICKAIHTYSNNRNPTNAVALYESFLVDIDLILIDENPEYEWCFPEDFNLRNAKSCSISSSSSRADVYPTPLDTKFIFPSYVLEMELKD